MNKELQKKLSKYSAAAVAVVATGAAANAQVVYTQVNKTLTGANNPVDSIDINQDGTYDLGMIISSYSSYNYAGVFGGPINSQGHALAGSSPSSFPYPFKLNAGEQINTKQFLPADSFGTFTIFYNNSNPFSSFWNGGVTDGYLGIKLNVNGNTHYGWVRMDMAADAKTVVIKDMAYNATAGGPIQAGQGLSVEIYEKIANSVWITGNQLHTDLQMEFNNATISLTDITGKLIQQIELTEAVNSIDLGDLPAGTYVLSLVMDGNTYNKKAVVQ